MEVVIQPQPSPSVGDAQPVQAAKKLLRVQVQHGQSVIVSLEDFGRWFYHEAKRVKAAGGPNGWCNVTWEEIE